MCVTPIWTRVPMGRPKVLDWVTTSSIIRTVSVRVVRITRWRYSVPSPLIAMVVFGFTFVVAMPFTVRPVKVDLSENVCVVPLKLPAMFACTASALTAPAPNTSCTVAHVRFLAFYDVAARDSIHANFETPLVLKPLASGEAWCLMAIMNAPAGNDDYAVDVSVGGYVPSGFFVPRPSSARPPKLGGVHQKR